MARFLTLSIILLVLLGAVAFIVADVTMENTPSPRVFEDLADNYQLEVIRDDYGVPHIYGKRDVDVAFGLAYAHAEDDFATIENVILATRGKMATRTGLDGAITDFLVHFMGVWPAVDAGYKSKLSPKARALAEAYADGINYYLSEAKPDISPYLLPVTGKDIVAGFTFKTPLFYGFDKTIAAVYEGRYGDRLAMTERGILPATGPGPELGSQGIAIAPHRTSQGDGGDTLLLVNSHHPLTGPVAWYEARLKSEEGWDIAGGTFPGAPTILHGAGPAMGWASTVNKPDLVDVYALKVNPENPLQYEVDGAWRDFEVKDAPITIHFFGPIRWTVQRQIKVSIFGPVLETDKGSFAVNWAGRGEVRSLDAFYAMNRAGNLPDFEEALKLNALPSINYIAADKTGNIAHYYNAMFPDRPKEDVDWSGVLDGTRSALNWVEYKAFSAMPRTVNPASGAVYNANNTPIEATDGPGAPAITDLDPSMGIQRNMTNRAERIKRLLSGTPVISMEAFHALKYDLSYDAESEMILAFKAFLEEPLPPEVRFKPPFVSALQQLKSWDLKTDIHNETAALGVLTLYPYVGARLAGTEPPPFISGFLDAVDHLNKHFGSTVVPFGKVNRLKRGTKDVAIAGGPDIVRAVYGWPANAQGQLVAQAGDSYIMFVRWSADGRFTARTVHSFGSATLDANSPHYDDQVDLFVAQQEKPLEMDKAALMEIASSRKSFGNYSYPIERQPFDD